MTDRFLTRPQVASRWLDREALADHLSVRVDQIPRMMRAGKLPQPSHALGPRNPRWWQADVDAALGLAQPCEQKGADLAAAIRKEAQGRAHRPQAPG